MAERNINPEKVFEFHTPNRIPRKAIRKRGIQSKPPVAPVVVVKPKEKVWETALQIAKGDVRKLQPNPDGSVTILNNRK